MKIETKKRVQISPDSQQTFTCSKSPIETLEKCVESVQN